MFWVLGMSKRFMWNSEEVVMTMERVWGSESEGRSGVH